MIKTLAAPISITFVFATLITVWFFFKASPRSILLILIIGIWLVFQAGVAISGFYTSTHTIPPRFPFLIIPPTLAIIFLFVNKNGKLFLDCLDPTWLTYLHSVRILVELVLLALFLQGKVPQLMTFEGRNFDILSGISAPVIGYFGYQRNLLNKRILLIWNLLCIGLLFNIVLNAILAAPGPLQRQAFDQPNVAILYFPFVWLPGFIVPTVMFAHLVCIRQLVMTPKDNGFIK